MAEKPQEPLAIIMEKLTILENGIKHLNQENGKRAQEIAALAKHNDLIETDDDSSRRQAGNSKDKTKIITEPIRESTSSDSSPISERRQLYREEENYEHPILAKDIIRTIEVLKGRDDCGVEDFISSVKRAKGRCLQKDLLLDFIIAEKITDQAKRAIQFTSIRTYEELFEALHQNVGIISSVELSRSRLEGVKQAPAESVQNFNLRFRQQFNELNYAVQNEHSNSTMRRLALQVEEKSAIKKYIMNLKEDIGTQVRPLKPTTLNQAQQEALESEVWFKERNQGRIRAPQSLPQKHNKPTTSPFQRQVTTNQVKYPSLSNPPNHAMPLQQRLQLFCNFCKNVGHQESQCYSKQKNFQKGVHSSRPPNRVNQL